MFLEFFSRTTWWRLFIKCLLCTYIYVALTGILIMDIVNHSAWLIASYHMIDAVVRGMFTPPMRLHSPTQLGVYCVYITLMFSGEFFG